MKRLFNQSGMSLLEVMMAAGILAVISVGVMTMTKNMSKSSRTATKAFDMESIMREIQTHMYMKENCSATVFGATATGNTVITGLKSINDNGEMVPHGRLRASTVAAPSYVAPGMIISGMFIRPVLTSPPTPQDHSTGANFELVVTFMKSVKANSNAVTADMTFGQNLTTRKIPLQVDNCARYIAAGPSVAAAAAQCSVPGGNVVGAAYGIYSDPGPAALAVGIGSTTYFQACQVCTTRPRVQGCL